MANTKEQTQAAREAQAARNAAEGFEVEPIGNRYMELVENPELSDPRQIAEDIARNLRDMDFDAALDAGEATALGADDIADRPFVITERPVWRKAAPQFSAYGSAVFVVLTVNMDDDGTTQVVTCGGENVLAVLYNGQTKGRIPDPELHLKFRAVPTASGYTTLYLARAK